MINILFDHQIFSLQQYGGISRYFCELATHLNRIDQVNLRILPFFHQNKHLLKATNITMKSRYIRPIRKTTLFRFFINTFLFEVYNRLSNPDLIHRTYYSKFIPCSAKQVTTIHDLIPEKYPEYFDNVELFLKLKQQSIQKSDYIICVSSTTKKDLIDYYKVPESKISVIHLASSLSFASFSLSDTIKFKNIPIKCPYILFVGARLGYKNFTSILKSISDSKYIKKDFNLICFGGPPFSVNELDLINGLDLENKVFQFNGSDELLYLLYNKASLFVYPSLYEGFGLPLIEAMSLKCPVACSNINIFNEISSNSVIYFDPKCTSSIIYSLEKILYSEKLRRELIEKGYDTAKKYSWAKSANETLSIYKKLIHR